MSIHDSISDAESPMRAVRHPHFCGMWCYRQADKAYENLRVGSRSFAEAGDVVCAIADIIDIKPDKILTFLQNEGYVVSDSRIPEEGALKALEHFGGSIGSHQPCGQSATNAESLELLCNHLTTNQPALIYIVGSNQSNTAVAAAGYDAEREEILIFDPRDSERDGWYSWEWLATRAKAFILATIPSCDKYAPRYIFKQIYGIDIAGHEQRWPDIDLASLQQVNPACLGWVHLDGTPISYPLVKDHLDSTYYQTHNFSGEPSIHGTACLSFANGGTFDAPNLVFSAHRMKDYSMFKMLTFYDRPDWSEEHPCINLLLGAHHYQARVFSAYHFPKHRDKEAFRVDFADNADFECWLYEREKLSIHSFPPILNPSQVATFRTCYGLKNDKTFAVHAQLTKFKTCFE